MTTTEVMRKALEAMENSLDLVQAEYTDNWRHGLPTRAAQLDGLKRLAEDHASAIEALRAEIERLGAAPSLTCQTFGEGVAVPCAECNTVLVDSQELAELRAMAGRLEAVEPVAWIDPMALDRIKSLEPGSVIMTSISGTCERPWVRPIYTAPIAPAAAGPACNPHPKAPHGFNRNASHSAGRSVCDCESWDPYDAGYQEGLLAGLAHNHTAPIAPAIPALTIEEVAEGAPEFADVPKYGPAYLAGAHWAYTLAAARCGARIKEEK